MSRRTTEIQVGVTVLLALGVLLWGVTWLRQMSLQRHVTVWHVRFPQTGGLSKSDEVQVNGIRMGDVGGVRLIGDHVVADLALDSDVHLTTDSKIAIRNVGLMGEKVIAVDLRTSGVQYTPRDTIEGIFELGMPEVMASLGGTVSAVDTLANELKDVAKVMSKNSDFNSTLKNFNKMSEDLRDAVHENRVMLRATLENFAAVSKTARGLTADREADLRKAMDHFGSAAEKLDHLAGHVDSLRATLQSITTKVDRGDGTLGKLVNDDRLYADTRASIDSLRALITDIKKNPKRYLSVHVF